MDDVEMKGYDVVNLYVNGKMNFIITKKKKKQKKKKEINILWTRMLQNK